MEKQKDKPLYQIIANDINQMIVENDFDYDSPICTERSICEKYNVSRITAKHAIKNLEKSGILYRKRGVGSFVTKLADTDNHAAPKKVFALIMPFNSSQGGLFMTVESASKLFALHQCQLTIHVSHSIEQDTELLNQLYAQNISGIVYYPRSLDLPYETFQRFIEINIPVIILDQSFPLDNLSSVVCDHYKGGYMLAEHLISYGHRNICYLSKNTPEQLTTVRDRYNGYVDCLKNSGISTPPQFIHWNPDDNEGYHLLKHIVNTLHGEGVTAILCETDEVAFNVYLCCGSLGIRVPEEMNITGFDNIEWATIGSARITTIDQNFSKIGEAVANILLHEPYVISRQLIPVQLIPRFSTRKSNTI